MAESDRATILRSLLDITLSVYIMCRPLTLCANRTLCAKPVTLNGMPLKKLMFIIGAGRDK